MALVVYNSISCNGNRENSPVFLLTFNEYGLPRSADVCVAQRCTFLPPIAVLCCHLQVDEVQGRVVFELQMTNLLSYSFSTSSSSVGPGLCSGLHRWRRSVAPATQRCPLQVSFKLTTLPVRQLNIACPADCPKWRNNKRSFNVLTWQEAP